MLINLFKKIIKKDDLIKPNQSGLIRALVDMNIQVGAPVVHLSRDETFQRISVTFGDCVQEYLVNLDTNEVFIVP